MHFHIWQPLLPASMLPWSITHAANACRVAALHRPHVSCHVSNETADTAFFKQLSFVARKAFTSALDSISVTNKVACGFDPVTTADVAIERELRQAIQEAFPSDGICGEELGSIRPGSPRQWSIDPIDGTRAFMCGLPSWTILVGLVENGVNVAGMIDVPALNELYVATDGMTTLNGDTVIASRQTSLRAAKLATTDPSLFADAEARAFERLRNAVSITRFGLDALGFARVACGGLDMVIEAGLKPHDYIAVIPVIRGAGGYVGDWRGGNDYSSGRLIAAATRELYDAAVDVLAW